MPSNPPASASDTSNQPEKIVPPEFDVDHYVDKFLSTMCDSSRRRILELLSNPEGQKASKDASKVVLIECRSTDIAKSLHLSPATTSGHLKQLANTGIVVSRREGNAIYYRLNNHFLVQAFRDLLFALDHHYNNNLHSLSHNDDPS